MTIIRVFDIETTGVDPKEHRITEIAAYDFHPENRIERVGAHLINPGRAIPPDASAIHHLIDADVAAAPLFNVVWPTYAADARNYYAAHNCDFERGYIPTPQGTHWICTYKCALRAWADAPSHGNQVLRYWLGLDGLAGFDRKLATPAHRAEADAYVTAWLLMKLMETASVDYLVLWTNEPKAFPKLTFGKHRGEKWSDVPADYLQWMSDQQTMDADWRHGAKVELERRSRQK
jgi:exodeoxyribonuclease X